MIDFGRIKAVIIYLFKDIWNYRKSFFVVFVLNFLISAFEPFISIVGTKFIIDELLGNSIFFRALTFALIMVILGFVVKMLLVVFSENLQKDYYEIFNNRFQAQLALKNMQVSYEKTEDKRYLDEAHKAKTGISLQYSGGIQGVAGSLSAILGSVISLFGAVGIIIFNAPILLAVVIVNVIINSIVNKKKSLLQVKQFEKLSFISRAFNYLYYTLSDIRYAHEIRLFRADRLLLDESAKYNAQQDGIRKDQQQQIFHYLKFYSINMAITTSLSFLYLGYLALKGVLTIGEFTMVISASTLLMNSINSIISEGIELRKKCTYADNFVAYMMSKADYPVDKSGEALECNNYEIEFSHVYFAYPNSDDYVLKDVSLKINAGEHLALVGQNGAGKSTFIKLVCRLYNVSKGDILLNGVSIYDYPYEQYIKMIAPVFQDFRLLAFSIKENIVINRENEDIDKELLAVIDKVGLTKKVNELPKGVNTAVFKHFDKEGFNPSGGEQQKIAIARALFKNAPMVVLDEPTAALDPIAENEIYQQFNEMVYGKTAIFVSHRLSSCKFCDKIAVFKDGGIIEFGNHGELIANKDGHYYEMYNAQAMYYNN